MTNTATSLIGFGIVAAMLTITPGLDTLLVLRTAAVEGRKRAAKAGLGIVIGCLAWGAMVALGLGFILAASQLLFEVIRAAGAAYLIYLGTGLLKKSARASADADRAAVDPRSGSGSWFKRGLTTNLLNPKIGVFYLSLLPQFVPPGANIPAFTMLLAAIHAATGLMWFALLIALTRRFARLLALRATIVWLDRITGGVLVAAGLKIGASVLVEARR